MHGTELRGSGSSAASLHVALIGVFLSLLVYTLSATLLEIDELIPEAGMGVGTMLTVVGIARSSRRDSGRGTAVLGLFLVVLPWIAGVLLATCNLVNVHGLGLLLGLWIVVVNVGGIFAIISGVARSAGKSGPDSAGRGEPSG